MVSDFRPDESYRFFLQEIPELLKELETSSAYEDQIDDLLKEKGVKHVSISYEKLYEQEDPSEWQKAFNFLGIEASGLTRKQINCAMDHASTSNSLHNVTIANFQEVRQALQGTPYQYLLKGTWLI